MRQTSKLKILSVILTAALIFTGLAPYFTICEDSYGLQMHEAPKMNAGSVVLMDMGSGKVLYEKNADKVREPASVTKILNCMVVLENMDLDQEVTISKNVETEGSIVGLKPGEKLSVEELIYGMMLVSGNDAAEELAKATAGSVSEFCEMMNERAEECGAEDTNYKNANGLNENKKKLNYTTAIDLALISREAMKNEKFREVVSTSKHTIPKTNKEGKRKLENSNVCLWLTKEKVNINGQKVPLKYEGCTGIKTGYTSSAGNCFVGTAKRGGSEFLLVVMGCDTDPARFVDAIKLWNFAFENYETYTILRSGKAAYEERVWGGELRDVQIGTNEDFDITVDKGYNGAENVKTEIVTFEDKVQAPVEKGTILGQVNAFDENGRQVGSADLYALESVQKGGPLSQIGIADEDLPYFYAVAGTLLLIIIVAIILIVKRKKKPEEE